MFHLIDNLMDYEAFQSSDKVKDCELALELLSTLVTVPELSLGQKLVLFLKKPQQLLVEQLNLK